MTPQNTTDIPDSDELLESPETQDTVQESEAIDQGDEHSEEQIEVDGDDTVVVTIGSEPSSENEENEERIPAPKWAKDLRKQYRESQRKIREYEAKLQSAEPVKSEPVLPKKPTLESFDFDPEDYENALEKWYDQKREYDQHIAAQKTAEEQQRNAWSERLTNYSKSKAELKVRDFEDAEEHVQQTLSQTQQGIIVQGAENAALLVYALGKNPKKVAELASINDPVKFAFAVAKIEKDLKMTPKKSIPPPEKTISGSARLAGTVDATLERLRAEAEKTGNYTKVIAYKRQSNK